MSFATESVDFIHKGRGDFRPGLYYVGSKTNPKKRQVISEANATRLAKFFVKMWKENPEFGFALLAEDVGSDTAPTDKPP